MMNEYKWVVVLTYMENDKEVERRMKYERGKWKSIKRNIRQEWYSEARKIPGQIL